MNKGRLLNGHRTCTNVVSPFLNTICILLSHYVHRLPIRRLSVVFFRIGTLTSPAHLYFFYSGRHVRNGTSSTSVALWAKIHLKPSGTFQSSNTEHQHSTLTPFGDVSLAFHFLRPNALYNQPNSRAFSHQEMPPLPHSHVLPFSPFTNHCVSNGSTHFNNGSSFISEVIVSLCIIY